MPRFYFNFEYIEIQAGKPKDRQTNQSKSIERGSTNAPTDQQLTGAEWMDTDNFSNGST